ncbi:hypothetical protein AB0N23_21895, partial [Streptomyces sp. NPDC052644]
EGRAPAGARAAGGPPSDAPPSGTGRRITLPTGYEMHPWADLRPAGEGAATPPPRKLWHQSQGSAG